MSENSFSNFSKLIDLSASDLNLYYYVDRFINESVVVSSWINTNLNSNWGAVIHKLPNTLNSSILNIYYDTLFTYNLGFLTNRNFVTTNVVDYFFLFDLVGTFFKITLLMFVVYVIFFISFLENYIKQLINLNNFARLFILNESEKEVGPVDDFFFFAIFFVLTLCSFVIGSLFIILFTSSVFVWLMGGLLLISCLILTVPLNLFIDFGISFVVYIRGSASSSSLIKELLFDIISTATVFIRFVIQNIRFLFIFLAIFELLEWVFANNSNFFLTNYYSNHNIFVNTGNSGYLYALQNVNLLVINTILFIILYLYYFLHLLFLLVVQIIIYVGISVWLFFFLYSTKFLGKYEKFFILKK